jgi:hypothetical protein
MTTEEDVRRIALSLPETSEGPSYGTTGWRVKGKLYARMREDPDALVVFRPDITEKEALIASDPERFFQTPHYGAIRPFWSALKRWIWTSWKRC